MEALRKENRQLMHNFENNTQKSAAPPRSKATAQTSRPPMREL